MSERAQQFVLCDLLSWVKTLRKKHLKVLVIPEQLKIIEELRILFRQPEAAFELLEKLPFFALDSGSYHVPTEPQFSPAVFLVESFA